MRVKNVNIEKRMVTGKLKQSINWAVLPEPASRFKPTMIARGRISPMANIRAVRQIPHIK